LLIIGQQCDINTTGCDTKHVVLLYQLFVVTKNYKYNGKQRNSNEQRTYFLKLSIILSFSITWEFGLAMARMLPVILQTTSQCYNLT